MPAPATSLRDTVETTLSKTFDQAQSSIANHQKNCVALYKLHLTASELRQSSSSGDGKRFVGERFFEETVCDMMSRVLLVKKGQAVADRIAKFLGAYIKVLVEKTEEEVRKEGRDEEEDTIADRFMARVFRHLLQAFVAKDKTIRYRAVQIVGEMLPHVGLMDEGLYQEMRGALLGRLHDKEPQIRAISAASLAKLLPTEEPDDVTEGETSILGALVDVLEYDTSPEVRRAALVNIHVTVDTIPHLLTRTRDLDSNVRKHTYSTVLERNCSIGEGEDSKSVGHAHPRFLSIEHREMVIKHGLGDREPSVRAAAASLVGIWVDVMRNPNQIVKNETPAQELEQTMLSFLTLFDLQEVTIPEEALMSVFKTRAEIFDNLEFGDAFWENLTPEKAFLARVFVDQCVAAKDDARLETALPVVTAMAFRIQERYNGLMVLVQDELDEGQIRLEEREEDRIRREEERMSKEFILTELLKLAVNLDYADEIGRRKMFQLVRAMIAHQALPEGLASRCLDVLRKLSDSERDLIMVVVEVIHELRDTEESDDEVVVSNDGNQSVGDSSGPRKKRSGIAMSAEEQSRRDAMDMRCLSLCIGMLERVNGTFEENSTLEGVLSELIVPAVRNKEQYLREKGLICLGLCCLIARKMAARSLQLFLNQIAGAPTQFKLRLLQVVFDVLMVHESDFLSAGSGDNSDKIVEYLLSVLKADESAEIHACVCIGLAKLLLSGMVTNTNALETIFLLYVTPETSDNLELRQCLSYFFPVYCYSNSENQRKMKELFLPLFAQITEMYSELEEGQTMVNPLQLASMLVDWMDPEKTVYVPSEVPGRKKDDNVHVDLAADVVKALFDDNLTRENNKILCQILSKLHLPEVVDENKIKTLKLLIYNVQSRRPPREAAAKNALAKFDATISNKYSAQLESFSEEDCRKLEYLKDLFEFLDDIIPEEEPEPEIPPPATKGKKRYVIRSSNIEGMPEKGSKAIDERRHDYNGWKRGRDR
ncbi:ARM repeat-containing protein [Thelephora ganbajun]|uniref:ARM repeat-containing protein n=1 Tax=Thelephora ganbajun TaxID=370292 RepID=A0ACB6ZF82_THEGA|nr:ARM repeat-containing protein [Thelephora ganbajun]